MTLDVNLFQRLSFAVAFFSLKSFIFLFTLMMMKKKVPSLKDDENEKKENWIETWKLKEENQLLERPLLAFFCLGYGNQSKLCKRLANLFLTKYQ